MLIFAPRKLIRAVDTIKEQHPLAGNLASTLSREDLEALVRRIDSREVEELETLAMTLSRRQVFALCGYLANNTWHVDLEKIARVVVLRMTSAVFARLFLFWQRYPRCPLYLPLLSAADTAENRPQDFPLEQGLLEKWNAASDMLAQVVEQLKQYQSGNYVEKYSRLGLVPGTALEKLCCLKYLSLASKEVWTQEGDEQITRYLEDADNEERSQVLRQLLALALSDHGLLTDFPGLHRMAYRLWGEPNRRRFPWEELFPAYAWWCNYRKVSGVLSGDQRRIRFWQPYLDRCTCTHYKGHEMLIFRFRGYVATEFEVQGPVYIFEESYFDDVVSLQMGGRRTADFKSWLFHMADYRSREIHSPNWEINEAHALRSVGIR